MIGYTLAEPKRRRRFATKLRQLPPYVFPVPVNGLLLQSDEHLGQRINVIIVLALGKDRTGVDKIVDPLTTRSPAAVRESGTGQQDVSGFHERLDGLRA